VNNRNHQDTPRTAMPARRKFDPLSFIAGTLTLLVATYVLADGPNWINVVDPRWILAGTAGFVGIVLLGAWARSGRG